MSHRPPTTPDELVIPPAGVDAMETVLPWLHEASNPFWDWFWGSSTAGVAQLQERIGRPSSELYCERIACLKKSGQYLGGYLALAGSELRNCRKADLLTLLKCLKTDPALSTRTRQAASLFPEVADEEFYLSRLGVASESRGMGMGRRLLDMYMRQGIERKFSRFRLDVSADNERAVALYREAGFEITGEAAINGANLRYYSMTRTV